MSRAPCKGCQDRTITCHGVCRRYEEWKKEEERRKTWEEQFKFEPSDQARRGKRQKLIKQARGIYRKRRRIGE